ncbi:MAG TPA: DUF805 domain-containing protein [Rhizobiaceae bacterium]|nr:DUF805 domain-containing protein [Rhizobiaceae bacterium]
MPDRSQLIWLFFHFSGRVDRAAYFLAGVLLYMARFYPVYRVIGAPDQATATSWAGVLILVTLASIYPHLALAAKRFHDFNRPGAFAAFFIVADFFLFLFLCFAPGNPGPNQYGKQTNAPA